MRLFYFLYLFYYLFGTFRNYVINPNFPGLINIAYYMQGTLFLIAVVYLVYSIFQSIKSDLEKEKTASLEMIKIVSEQQNTELQHLNDMLENKKKEVYAEFEEILTLINNQKYENIPQIVESATQRLVLDDSMPYTSNQAINALLHIKKIEAAKSNITMNYQILISDHINIDDVSISSVLFNLLDNAINATKEIENASILLEMNERDDYLVIHINNPYTNKKETSIIHGYGMMIVDEIVKKYEGHMVISEEENYDIKIMLYNGEKL